MPEASMGFAGNLTDDPELRHTEGGLARATFRVAVSGRNRNSEPSFFTVIVWRDQAEHVAESLSKGSRVVVVGRLQQRTWTAEDGSARQVVEVVAEELGPSLRWATPRRSRPLGAPARSRLRCTVDPVMSGAGRREGEQHAGGPFRRSCRRGGRKNFLYILKAGLRAAACGGRPRPAGPGVDPSGARATKPARDAPRGALARNRVAMMLW
jgi:single-strand DNA-binding protein